jgi:Lantibiotic dehydratase, N terminus
MTISHSPPTHAVLPGTNWALWRQVVVRAAGFPAPGVELMTSPALARAADGLNEREQGGDGDGRRLRYEAEFQAETERLTSQILGLAGDRRLGMALAWQNHHIFESAIAPMLRNKASGHIRRNSKQRQHEELIANYWQRYCLKNDTVGFFGPSCWAVLDPLASHTRLRAGKELIASSEVFFEPWAIDQLAAVIAAEPGMAPWIRPRKLPFVRVEGKQARRLGRSWIELTETEAAVLRQCTGHKPACDIAAERVGRMPGGTAEDVYSVISRLSDKRLLAWKLELPLSPRPERHLRRFLQHVRDPELAARGLERLDQLEAARDAAQAASRGDPAGFVAALRNLDEVFMSVTGGSPSRRAGRSYGGRTLIYHDARRDAELVLGADFLAALEPLGLILDSARWLTFHFYSRLQGILTGIATRMGAGGAAIDLVSFWFECMPTICLTGPAIISELQRDFQRKWADLLRVPPGARRVAREGAALRDDVRATFAAPHSGWSGGRYCSPDLMVAASGIDAINRGDFTVVLGELHLAIASSRSYCFVTQHPSPGDLLGCLAVDSPGPRLLPVVPREDHDRLTIRTQSALSRDTDFMVALTVQTADPDRPRLLDAADLTVTPGPGGPVVAVPDGPSFPVIDVFAEMLTQVFMNSFALMPKSDYQPRVAIDRLIIARETWRFEPDEIGFARVRDEAGRYAAARNWQHTVGLPGQVFVKVPGEVKPFYADFGSVHSVNILARSLRRRQGRGPEAPGSQVQFSEMLPATGELWLTDSAAGRYTSEIRIVAVDQRGASAAD